MSLTAVQNAEVRAAMQQYVTAYRNKDVKGLTAVFSPGICGFGSGPDEIIRGKDEFIRQITRDMSQATVNAVEFTDTNIFGEGRVAWLMTKTAISFTLPGGKMQTLQGRSTMVMKNNGSGWKIEQIHFSLPFGGQSAGQSFPGA
ncbi:MAG: nuclear transport factor 2 family protein [Methanoregula sp.]|jgi:ketosteroid isomerase-like protein